MYCSPWIKLFCLAVWQNSKYAKDIAHLLLGLWEYQHWAKLGSSTCLSTCPAWQEKVPRHPRTWSPTWFLSSPHFVCSQERIAETARGKDRRCLPVGEPWSACSQHPGRRLPQSSWSSRWEPCPAWPWSWWRGSKRPWWGPRPPLASSRSRGPWHYQSWAPMSVWKPIADNIPFQLFVLRQLSFSSALYHCTNFLVFTKTLSSHWKSSKC